ncbi:MAG TPA: hypothetical protein VHD35_00400 [Chitinophagaceae bacterium]|nr:hypothetical protein [Chitinophagaceae bacterium]
MRRAKHPVPMAIKELHFDVQQNCYLIVDAGITYQMPLEMTRRLKQYFVWNNVRTKDHNVADWYESLSKEERKQVIRINAPEEANGFYPDALPW